MTEQLLNPQQLKAVQHVKGPMMVLAGPGSGKTMVITHRVKQMVEQAHIDPKEILVITFTKAAAEEMRMRYDALAGTSHHGILFGTFHSIFFRILRSYHNYNVKSIIGDDVQYNVLRNIIQSLHISYEDEQEFIQMFKSDLSLMKNELIELKYYNPLNFPVDDFQAIAKRYEHFKKEKNLIDFDDMLVKCYQLLSHVDQVRGYWQKRYPYILIDEFQDINRAQYEIIKMLTQPNNNLFVVGDDDQSIYKFRGARPEFLLNFPQDFEDTESVTLNINYRSNASIVKKSSRVIKKNGKRYDKDLVSHKGQGSDPTFLSFKDTEEEARKIAEVFAKHHSEGVPYGEMAVIFRTNLQARAMVDAFLDFNMPFMMRDQAPSIYDHWIAKDMLAYLYGAYDTKDSESLSRIINKPKRYVSKWLLTELKRSTKDFFKFFYEHKDLKAWQIQRIEELEGQLILLKVKKPGDAIHYIRKVIGYDDYLKEYASYKKIGMKGLKEVLDELQESAKHFETTEDWLHHIEEVKVQLKEQYQKKNRVLNEDKITLTTMHSSKGLEFEVIWMISVVEGVIPHEKSFQEETLEEERRLFYVGLTRAKEKAYISSIETRYEEEVAVSRFVDEMEGKIDISQVEEGMEVEHKSYGQGIIKELKGDLAVIKFKKILGTKKLDLSLCLKNNLVSIKGEDCDDQ